MYEFGKRILQRLFYSQGHKRRPTWKRVINAERGITVVIKLGPLMAWHARQRNTITYVLLVYGRNGKQETWHTRLDGISNPLASYYRFGCTKSLLPSNPPQFIKTFRWLFGKVITLIFARGAWSRKSEFSVRVNDKLGQNNLRRYKQQKYKTNYETQ